MVRKKAMKPKTKRTTRIGKTDRVPKTHAGGLWTRAAFWGFVRSNLRKMSQRWPPLASQALLLRRRKSEHPTNKLLKWEYQCTECRGWFARKDTHLDHIEACGSLKSFDDLPGFVRRLLCEVQGIRVSCTTCHKARHDAEKGHHED